MQHGSPLPPLHVRFKREHPEARVPAYATAGASCMDLSSVDAGLVPVGGSRVFSTGLSFAVPEGHVMLVFSRSGHGFKHGVRLSNSTGVIDSDYRGVVAVALRNDGEAPFAVMPGDRIAQAMVVPLRLVDLVEADALDDTARGAAGFGSTGTGAITEAPHERRMSDREWAALPAGDRELPTY